MGLIMARARGGGERGEGHCWGRDTQVVFLSVGGSGREVAEGTEGRREGGREEGREGGGGREGGREGGGREEGREKGRGKTRGKGEKGRNMS